MPPRRTRLARFFIVRFELQRRMMTIEALPESQLEFLLDGRPAVDLRRLDDDMRRGGEAMPPIIIVCEKPVYRSDDKYRYALERSSADSARYWAT